MKFELGLVNEITYCVTEDDTAAAYGSGLVPVLSTPHLIALMEKAAQLGVAPYLDAEMTTVGTQMAMQHLAATPVGMAVRVRAALVAVEGRQLRFQVTAWDAVDKIGEGEHTRFVVNVERFMARVEEKLKVM